MKKEIILFLTVFIFLALVMHFKEWLDHPLAHIEALPTAGAYGIGAFHPLVFTVAIYLILGFFRVLFKYIKKLFNR